jgi:hypothetical protein
VQCVSTATCESAFNVQNLIKTKVRNRLGSKNLDAINAANCLGRAI